MADEIVGTAYVRIKALTKGLGKDIKKSVEKGMKDAKLDKVGEDAGKELGTSMGDSTVDSASERIKERSGDLVSDDVFDDLRKKVKDRGGLFGDVDFFSEGTEDRLRDSLRGQSNFLDSHLDEINANIDAKWPKDRDRDLIPGLERSRKKTQRESNIIGDTLAKLRKKILDFDTPQFGGTITKALGGIAGLAVAALPYIQDIGAGILAYATGIVAQIGFLVTAAGGLGAAAGAAGVAALLPLFPIMLAFKAESDILTEFKDSMAATAEEFETIGLATQETLLPRLDEAIFILGDLIPLFAEYGEVVGEIAGDYSLLAADILTGERAQGRFQTILEGSLSIFEKFLAIIINVGDILSGIFVAAMPIAIRFSDTLLDTVTRWAELVNTNLDSGNLTRTLEIWYDRADTLFGALGDLAGALFDILQVGADSSDSVFERFAVWAEEYRAWTESEVGQNKLKLIFDNALAVMREVNGVIAELFGGVGRLDEEGGVDGIVSALQTFRDMIPDLKESWAGMYEAIKGVVEYLADKAVTVFNDLREPLGEVGDNIKELLDNMEDTNSLAVFVDLMVLLTDTLVVLLNIPGLGQFLSYMLALGAAFKIAAVVLGPFIGLFKPLTVVIGGVAAAVGFLAGGFANLFAGGTLLAGLGGPIIGGGAAVAIAGVAAAIAAVVAVVAGAVLIWKNWDTIIEFFTETVPEVFGDLPEIVSDAFDTALEFVEDFVGDAIDFFVDFVTGIPGALLDLGGALVRGFTQAIGAAINAIPGLLLGILDLWLTLMVDIPLTLADLALRLVEAWAELVGTVANWLATTGIPMVVKFFLELPGNIIKAMDSLGDRIIGHFEEMWAWLSTSFPGWIDNIVQYFRDLPGNFIRGLGRINEQLWTLFFELMEGIRSRVGERIDRIVEFFTGLPGRLLGIVGTLTTAAASVGAAILTGIGQGISGAINFIGDVGRTLFNALARLMNTHVIGNINDALEFRLEIFGRGVDIDPPDLPRIPLLRSKGGFVDSTGVFGGGPVGTDTVPAWLTPGEFVLRRSVAQAIPAETLHALNAGNPRLLSMLNSISRGRPASGSTSLADITSATAATRAGAGGGVFGPNSVVIYAQGTSAREVYNEFDHRVNWKLTSRGDR